MSTNERTRKPRGLSLKKRHQIVQSAIIEFDKYGFSGANMDRLAANADVSKRTVYNHFPSKDDLFEAIVNQMLIMFSEAARLEFQVDEAVDKQLENYALLQIRSFHSDEFKQLSRIVIAELFHNADRVSSLLNLVESRSDDFNRFLLQAINMNQLKIDDLKTAEMQFSSLIKGKAFWPIIIFGKKPLSDAEQSEHALSTVAMFMAKYGIV